MVLVSLLLGSAIAAAIIHLPSTIERTRKTKRLRHERAVRMQRRIEKEQEEDAYDAAHQNEASDRPMGIALSFDDREPIACWHKFFTRADVQCYSPRVTFFVWGPDLLTDDELSKLRELQALGHEIACHGLRHRPAPKYIKEHGLERYLKNEIEPAIEIMERQGFGPVRCFAYPGGARDPAIDDALLGYFSIVRGTLKCSEEERNTRRKYWYTISPNDRGKKFLWADTLDELLRISPQHIKNHIELAESRGRILLLYGHDITNDLAYYREGDDPRHYVTVWHEDLKAILEFAHKRGMRFYTMSELE
ncbi:MAG: DUF2334 domain-containing protein [Planctomycetota bacterium]|jgi:peptidoglycan/xylan/chitin deacetylase (PgdA/CDA1 family)